MIERQNQQQQHVIIVEDKVICHRIVGLKRHCAIAVGRGDASPWLAEIN